MDELRATRAADAQAFLDATLAMRLVDPVETNVLGSIAASVADGSRVYDQADWWLVRAGDEIVGAATHTDHYRPVLSPMSSDAARVLADAVYAQRPGVRGVTGPDAAASAFAKRLRELTGADTEEVTLRELIYVLGTHTPRAGVPGTARRATAADVPMLIDWFTTFGSEALGSIHVVTADDILRRMAQRDLLIWEVGGVPTAMAGHAALTPSPRGPLGRIGPVFTEATHRGQGFGAAVTSAMVEHLHALGCTTVLLYTDADYPQSNKVYSALGFEPVGSVVELGGVSH